MINLNISIELFFFGCRRFYELFSSVNKISTRGIQFLQNAFDGDDFLSYDLT